MAELSLAKDFAAAGEATWRALVEEALAGLRDALARDTPGDDAPSYAQLIERAADEPPRSYRFRSSAQRDLARDAVRDLVALADRWAASGESLAAGAPRPRPELRIRPRE